jgi:hypothetical protein
MLFYTASPAQQIISLNSSVDVYHGKGLGNGATYSIGYFGAFEFMAIRLQGGIEPETNHRWQYQQMIIAGFTSAIKKNFSVHLMNGYSFTQSNYDIIVGNTRTRPAPEFGLIVSSGIFYNPPGIKNLMLGLDIFSDFRGTVSASFSAGYRIVSTKKRSEKKENTAR